jgi:hypothetical protein
MKSESSGMTITEMLITIFISGILFVMIGKIIINTQSLWQRGISDVAVESDIRVFKTKLGYVFRNARSVAALSSPGCSTLSFVDSEGKNVVVRLSGNSVTYTDGNYRTENILGDVDYLEFFQSGQKNSHLEIHVGQQKLFNSSTNERILKDSTLTISCRILEI